MSWGVLEPLGASWGVSWRVLRASRGHLRVSGQRSGCMLGRPGDFLGRLGSVLGCLESVLSCLWAVLGMS